MTVYSFSRKFSHVVMTMPVADFKVSHAVGRSGGAIQRCQMKARPTRSRDCMALIGV